jgi:hypothetical protein
MWDTINPLLILTSDGLNVVRWYVDTSYGATSNLGSTNKAIMTLGTGNIYNCSRKQKIDTTSSTKTQLVAAKDIMSQMMWNRHFLLAQGNNITHRILYQDNKSNMLLQMNGLASSSCLPLHINMHFLLIKQWIAKGAHN